MMSYIVATTYVVTRTCLYTFTPNENVKVCRDFYPADTSASFYVY